MFRVIVPYKLGIKIGYIQIELYDYIGNENILQRIDNIHEYIRDHYYTIPEMAIEEMRTTKRRVIRNYESNINIIIPLEEFIENGTENEHFELEDLNRIDPDMDPINRNFEWFVINHPNDEYFKLTIEPHLFFYHLYLTVKELNENHVPLGTPFTINEFNNNLNPTPPEIPSSFGFNLRRRDGKYHIVSNPGTAKFFLDVKNYVQQVRTLQDLVRIKRDQVLSNNFSRDLLSRFMQKFYSYRSYLPNTGRIFHPGNMFIIGLYHAIFKKNQYYFSMDMIKTIKSLSIKRAKTYTFEDLKSYAISKELYDIYQNYSEFKGDICTLIKIIEPIISDVYTKYHEMIPKGIDFREYIILMILKKLLPFCSFEQFRINLSYYDNEFFTRLNISSEYLISIRKLENYHMKMPKEIFIYLFERVTEKLIELKVVNSSLLVGDGTFIHSYASNYKNPKTGDFNDRTAGFTVHDDKIKGLGYYYIVISAFHHDRIIPIHITVYPGNIHESKVLSYGLTEVYRKKVELGTNWKYLVYDSGGYSPLNFDLGVMYDIQLISPIGRRGNEDTLFQSGRYSFYSVNDMPDGWGTRLIDYVLRKRGHSESLFSFNFSYNDLVRAHSKDIVGVTKEIFFTYFLNNCVHLASALLNRSDLFGHPTAFKQYLGLNFKCKL